MITTNSSQKFCHCKDSVIIMNFGGKGGISENHAWLVERNMLKQISGKQGGIDLQANSQAGMCLKGKTSLIC
jgi:hypothetical protein